MPDLVRYQLTDGPHAGEATSERGEIERLARACLASEYRPGLDSDVVETRFNVVRSGVPHRVETIRKLRDYLPSVEHGDTPGPGDVPLDEAAMAIRAWFREGHAAGAWFPPI